MAQGMETELQNVLEMQGNPQPDLPDLVEAHAVSNKKNAFVRLL